MAQYNRYGQARKKRKTNAFFAPVALVLVLVAMVFVVGLFFRVQNIEVIGSQSYTDTEIIEASGIEKGDNLFFINRFSASTNIFSKLPYVDAASIERSMPNTIIITVDESRAAAYLSWQGQNWMITATGKLLGSVDAAALGSLVKVVNLEPVSPTVGETFNVAAEDELKKTYLLDLLQTLQADGLTDNVKQIDLSNPSNPSMDYLGRFTVQLGSDFDLDYKLRMLMATVNQLGAEETGIIDVSDGATVYVSPD